MREILFKGKRNDNGEWAEGSLLKSNESYYIVPYFGVNSIEDIIGYACDKLIILHAFEIDPETVCQYTGLTDKNGRKIFEGDIIKCVYDGNMNVRLVIWDESELDFKGTNGKESYGKNFDYLPSCEELVVIGNIFDNPELLKGDDSD